VPGVNPASDAAISVLLPTRRGGALLERVVRAVRAQTGTPPFEILLVDSGSPAGELESLARLGARIESIPPESFDHGTTRDLAAGLASGDLLVYLNQDALPVDERWLARLTAPFAGPDPPAAVQGGIRELPEELLAELGLRRFFWDSCGARFYFTRESRDWIAAHGGIGFSTVNAAFRRSVLRELPFGAAPILEDKKWQAAAHARGLRIVEVPEAAVWHTHDYALGPLLRRCASEGFGWRGVGARYPLRAALADVFTGRVWREWAAGVARGRIRRASELLFPVARPLALWWGNRWSRRVHH
jgi:rhamnosyltransferase